MMKHLTSCLIVLSVLGACAVMSFSSDSSSSSSSEMDMSPLYPEAVAAALRTQDEALTQEQILEKLVSAIRGLPNGAGHHQYDYGSLGLNKRQIRYHQCYFNPISCFRRRK